MALRSLFLNQNMKFLKDNWLMLMLISLVTVLLVLTIQNRKALAAPPIIVRTIDTIIYVRDSVIYAKPILIKEIKDSTPIYIPDADYGILLNQFEELKQQLLTTRIYSDSSKFDSSIVKIIDTLKNNELLGRSYVWDLKIPTITITNNIQPIALNQFYLGGLIQAGKFAPTQITLNGLIKTRKDKIFGVGAGINTNGNFVFNIQSY